MCGRFALVATGPELAALFGSPALAGFRVERRYNVAPGQWILIVRPDAGGRGPAQARWGLAPPWSQDGPRPINARAESVAGKPFFRTALRKSRCLVPASGFFEWKAGPSGPGRPWFIRLRGGTPFAFAGLCSEGKDGDLGCAILTTTPNGLMASIHDRMPVILPPESFGAWLDPEAREPGALLDLLRPFPAGAMEAWPVGPAVGDVHREGPSLLEEIPLETPLLPPEDFEG